MIDVATTTWPNHPLRFDYFRRTMESLQANLWASRHKLRMICSAETAQDTQHRWMGRELEEFCAVHHIDLHWHDAAPNLGANLNQAIRLCPDELIYVQQDDWCLDHKLDLSPGAEFLTEHQEVDLLRYSWPDNDRMRPTFIPQADGWRRIDIRGRWPYGDDPHLRRQDFMRKWGWYLEGGRHASASSDLMTKLRRGNANIRVADRCYYHHFGKISSYPAAVESRPGRRR